MADAVGDRLRVLQHHVLQQVCRQVVDGRIAGGNYNRSSVVQQHRFHIARRRAVCNCCVKLESVLECINTFG